MEKRDLSEEDIKARYITPAVEQSGWDKKQIRYRVCRSSGCEVCICIQWRWIRGAGFNNW